MWLRYLILLSVLIFAVQCAEKDSNHSKKDNSLSDKNQFKRSSYYHGLAPEAYNYGYHIPSYGAAKYASGYRPASSLGYSSQLHYSASSPDIPLSHHHLHASPVHFAAAPVAAPTIFSPGPTQYALRPGGAVVQSYQVNYPQYHHKTYPSYAVAPQPIAPAAIVPQHFHYHTPIAHAPIPIAHPSVPLAHPISHPQVPFAHPHIPISHHHIPVAPTQIPFNPTQISFASTQIPTVPAPPVNFFVPNNRPQFGVQFATLPQRPIIVPFQIPSPAPTPLIPISTGIPSSVIPIAGTGLASGQIPTSVTPTHPTPSSTPWRPIFVNQPPSTAPTTPESSANRPVITLLPPYRQQFDDEANDGQQQYYQIQGNRETTEENYYGAAEGYHY